MTTYSSPESYARRSAFTPSQNFAPRHINKEICQGVQICIPRDIHLKRDASPFLGVQKAENLSAHQGVIAIPVNAAQWMLCNAGQAERRSRKGCSKTVVFGRVFRNYKGLHQSLRCHHKGLDSGRGYAGFTKPA